MSHDQQDLTTNVSKNNSENRNFQGKVRQIRYPSSMLLFTQFLMEGIMNKNVCLSTQSTVSSPKQNINKASPTIDQPTITMLMPNYNQFNDEESLQEIQQSSAQSLLNVSEPPQPQQSYSYSPGIQLTELERFQLYKISHECGCLGEDCNGTHCDCFLTPREICVIGECCVKCIEAKNQFLRVSRGWQIQTEKKIEPKEEDVSRILRLIKQKNCTNMHYLKSINPGDATFRHLTFCTCKKSHCQKKYCICFQQNAKCGEFCFCSGCRNKDEDDSKQREQERQWQLYAIKNEMNPLRQEVIDQLIEKYLEGEIFENGIFSETMQFQSPNFEQLYQSLRQ